MFRPRHALSLASAAILMLGLAACGEGERDSDSNSDGGGGSASGSWTLGTTETVTAMDPAGSYDIGSWNMQYSIFEQLLVIPAGEPDPVGDAAESCDYDDPQTITCTLREGLTFSNGNELTSSDVAFSMKRNLEIADPNGSSVLLGAIKDPDKDALAEGAIETPDDQTVVFHLNQPDLTFIKILSSATASIVDEETFPADELMADEEVVGSGPYMLSKYSQSKQAVLEANPEYDGDRAPASKTVFVQYFNDAAPLRNAAASSQVDVAWRTLSPTDLASIEDEGSVDVLRGEGSEFRYWVWQLGTPIGKDKAVRQAVAQIIDREAIAQNAYDGTVEPSYSIVPPGFGGQRDSFAEVYGESPDVDAAKQTLQDAGVKTPVQLTLGYTPTHYGPNAVDEATELAGQLNDSGLFQVSTEDAEWEEYQTLYKENAYDLFILGWYPDFLDADNYLTPFLRDGGFFQNGYSNDEVNSLLDQELGETDEATRDEQIGELQDIVAEDVPLIPSWNGQNVAVAVPEMEGVAETLDPTYIFRFWEISKG
ncbi:Oligopeptide-binding protein OppA precursor [Nocardioides dokdonensis FR1436]|uniref:Oligopeptide-binding protein OppA n=1 Tax=Nocardioides dokdonensis FR1436 TaxID=1300347 RepID=A0A1A9GN77_9ACTN|nr:ABC transporter substrate-binding protein [Nocardioides dokdonensis]ANH39734.1 Oligopeptide-binding protein OppA precursor [Nocardioides dokdonensis FR1436]